MILYLFKLTTFCLLKLSEEVTTVFGFASSDFLRQFFLNTLAWLKIMLYEFLFELLSKLLKLLFYFLIFN